MSLLVALNTNTMSLLIALAIYSCYWSLEQSAHQILTFCEEKISNVTVTLKGFLNKKFTLDQKFIKLFKVGGVYKKKNIS